MGREGWEAEGGSLRPWKAPMEADLSWLESARSPGASPESTARLLLRQPLPARPARRCASGDADEPGDGAANTKEAAPAGVLWAQGLQPGGPN